MLRILLRIFKTYKSSKLIMINNCRENAFVNKRLQRKDSCSLHLYEKLATSTSIYCFRIYFCVLIVCIYQIITFFCLHVKNID